ncbi:MAG: magnesium/cobalt transporter CorA [Planctomycetes bacterium]|nr:magnesium/cobalt transporter CorA [Planctomycetota bacterium]
MPRRRTSRAPAGAPPGIPVVAPESLPPRIHAIRYSQHSIEEMDLLTVDECRALVTPSHVTWIDVQGLGNVELLKAFGERFGLHPLAVEDIATSTQRPKMDDYDTHLYVITRMPEPGEMVGTDQTSIFIGPNFVITFQEHYGDCLGPVRERLRKGKGLMRRSGSDYLAYTIIDAIVDGYFPILETHGERLEALEDDVIENPTRNCLAKIYEAKRNLLTLRRAMWPLRDAVNSMIREESDLVTPQTRTYLRDCYDHAVQILDMVETYRELAAGLTEIYVSSLSQKLNEVMKVLTIISTIFIPLTFIAGVYGMNFDLWPPGSWSGSFTTVMIGMTILAILMIFYFVRKGWIELAEFPVIGSIVKRIRAQEK